ncbi:alpha/beta-hydrolase [Ramaria rubella]|nr:alpha/beta-hydrolase [Ramaria rubella]
MPLVQVSSTVQIHYLVPSCLDHSDTLDHTKPTVVLLHPEFFDSYFFALQYRDARLARGYNLVTLDHHHHGRTEALLDEKPYDFKSVAQDMLDAMDVLGIKKAHVFGLSLGSRIAVMTQILAPDRVLSLLLCGLLPDKETADNLEQYRFLRDACYEKADDGTDRLPSDVVHALHWIYFGGNESAQNLLEEWVEASNFKPSNRQLITKMFSTFLDHEPIAPELWGNITCPVIVLQGANDVACSEDVAKDVYDKMCRASKEIHLVANAPHFLSWTHAFSVNVLVANFLDRITGVESKEDIPPIILTSHEISA